VTKGDIRVRQRKIEQLRSDLRRLPSTITVP
jgi:hypothetical protein